MLHFLRFVLHQILLTVVSYLFPFGILIGIWIIIAQVPWSFYSIGFICTETADKRLSTDCISYNGMCLQTVRCHLCSMTIAGVKVFDLFLCQL